MKKRILLSHFLFSVLVSFPGNISAQYHTGTDLPKGAIARFGKGWSNHQPLARYSEDGTRLAVSTDIGIWLYDTHTSAEISVLPTNVPSMTFSFSPSGKTIAGTREKRVFLWETDTGHLQKSLDGHRGNVLSMAFSPDGKTIATGGADKLVHMWNTESGQKTILQNHTHEVTTLAFSPDGKTLASGEGPPREWTVHLWDTETGQYKSTLEGYRYGISSYGFSPDGKLLVTAGNQDETILLWNPESGTPEHRFRGHEKGVASFLFSHDGTKIATASHVHVVRLWDVYSGELVYTFEGHKNGSTLAFSPDGGILSIGSGDGKILSWSTETGQRKYTLKYPESGAGPVTSIAYSPDGQTLVTATHGPEGETPRVWQTRTGKFQRALTGHTKRVTSRGLFAGWNTTQYR